MCFVCMIVFIRFGFCTYGDSEAKFSVPAPVRPHLHSCHQPAIAEMAIVVQEGAGHCVS